MTGGATAGGVWLREHLLDLGSALSTGDRAVVVRAWADPVRLREPVEVGRREVFLVAVGGTPGLAAAPGFGAVLDAFTAAGWSARRHGPEADVATASRDAFTVRVHGGEGILTFTGWTPVVFTDRELRQPHCTRTTAEAVLCHECEGWGVCLDCEGTARAPEGVRRRCRCVSSNAGPGRCGTCLGTGAVPAEALASLRRRHGTTTAPRPRTVEADAASHLEALITVAHLACPCGEFRALWRTTLTREPGGPFSTFTATCKGCAALRTHTFALPA
ncbi:hypothetical protein EDD29_3730 [Actinocorallia herbida]|uniref:Uncharacterized protein n=1 Tax=Actinocorallia herbida TaxID=58109 RepID=A0A3N1CXZ1_9ACTN|nr:hypothetical protein [Actinocorallia herbida]ROO86167.1 hypothetical protein EDD29_3730 [Actinocorallia herbida]